MVNYPHPMVGEGFEERLVKNFDVSGDVLISSDIALLPYMFLSVRIDLCLFLSLISEDLFLVCSSLLRTISPELRKITSVGSRLFG